MYANSTPGSVHALDLSGIKQPNISVWTVWHGTQIAGIGALKIHREGYGKISLEVGTGLTFEPALALYVSYGFIFGEAFAAGDRLQR